MTDISEPTRRTLLLVGGSGVGLAALSACSSGSTGSGSGSSAAAPAGSTGSSAASSGPASTPGSSGPTSAGSSSAAQGLIALADVPVGGGVAVNSKDGRALIVTQPTKGTVRAMSSKCTHMGCKVAPKGGELDCPCHGSRYDLSGKVLQGPAPSPLESVAVTIVGGQVVQS